MLRAFALLFTFTAVGLAAAWSPYAIGNLAVTAIFGPFGLAGPFVAAVLVAWALVQGAIEARVLIGILALCFVWLAVAKTASDAFWASVRRRYGIS